MKGTGIISRTLKIPVPGLSGWLRLQVVTTDQVVSIVVGVITTSSHHNSRSRVRKISSFNEVSDALYVLMLCQKATVCWQRMCSG